MIEDCLAIILAGGESQRMGHDKAALILGEQSLLQHVITPVQSIFAQVRVSVRQRRADIALPQLCDACANAGPLAGLSAGLEEAERLNIPWIFAVATDMPFLRPALIAALAARRTGFEAVVPLVGGHPQPLAAFYSITALAPIGQMLAGPGKRSLRALLDALNVCYVHESELRASDPGLRSFFDLDTPEDLTLAKTNKE